MKRLLVFCRPAPVALCYIYCCCCCCFFIQNYRYDPQPTDDGVANGKQGKKKKNRKEELENLKREVEMVNIIACQSVSRSRTLVRVALYYSR